MRIGKTPHLAPLIELDGETLEYIETQFVAGHQVDLHKSPKQYDELVACIDRSNITLTNMFGYAAGSDSWMRQIELPCECGETYVVGETENGACCNDCYEEAGDENAIQDGHAYRDKKNNEVIYFEHETKEQKEKRLKEMNNSYCGDESRFEFS